MVETYPLSLKGVDINKLKKYKIDIDDNRSVGFTNVEWFFDVKQLVNDLEDLQMKQN